MRDRIRDLFTRLRNRDGQAIVLLAVSMAVMLIFLAFVIDAAHAFVDQRHLQNTADAAALAAAQQLGSTCTYPGSPSTCVGPSVTQYVSYNTNDGLKGLVPCGDPPDFNATPNCYQYQWPYQDPSCPLVDGINQCVDQVLVTIHQCTDTFFGGIVGIGKLCESVRSVARGNRTPLTGTQVVTGTTIPSSVVYNSSTGTTVIHGTTVVYTTTTPQTILGTTTPGTTVMNTVTTTLGYTITSQLANNAMFAADMTCGSSHGIVFQKNNADLTSGFIHSNGSINLVGNNNTVGAASYGQTGGSCGAQGATYGTAFLDPSYNYTPPSPPAVIPWPVPWPSPATVCQGAHNITTFPSAPYPGGTYCDLNGSLGLCDVPQSGNLTVVAQSITIDKACSNQDNWPDGNYRQTFSAGTYGLLFYATTGDITFASNGNSLPKDAFGFLFAPKGSIDYGKNNGANGFWEAQDIFVDFNNFDMTGFGPGGTPQVVSGTTIGTTTIPQTITGTTNPGTTVFSTGTGTTTTPNTTSTVVTSTPVTLNGTTQGDITNTVTTGTSTDLHLKQ